MSNISFIYWCIIGALLIFALIGKSSKFRELLPFMAVLSFLVAIRCEVGHDYVQYVGFYQDITFKSAFVEDFEPEIGAFGSLLLFKWMGLGVELWFFSISMLTFLVLFVAFQRFKLCNLRWSLLIYFSLFFFMNHCNIMQHGVMSAFVWLAFSYIKDCDWKRFLLFLIIGASFHMLAWAMFPFYWLLRQKESLFRVIFIILGAILIHILFMTQIYDLATFGFFANKMVYYKNLMESNNSKAMISLGVIIYMTVLVWSFFLKSETENKEFSIVRNALLYSITFQIVFLGSGIFDARLGGLFNISLTLFLPYIENSICKVSKGMSKIVLIVYTLIMFVTTVTTPSYHFSSGYEFIPYKTIFDKSFF